MGCATLTKDQDPVCPLPPGGTVPVLYVANSEDVDSLGDNGNGGFNTITMKAGKYLRRVKGFRNDMKKKEDVANPGIGVNQFIHDLGLVGYSHTQEDKNEFEALCRGNFIFFSINRGKDLHAVEVAGATQGMEVVPGTIRDMHANGGYYVMEFKTPDGGHEPKLMQTFSLGSSYDDNIDYLEALLEP